MNINELLIKHIIIEFPVIPLKTLLKIVNFYGLRHIISIFIYLVIKIAPLKLLIIFFEILACISIINRVNRSKISKLRSNIIYSKKLI
jgi:hypothetical protein